MQQHPVPQNITGFEFKLVGFLTLKQFLYLAGAGVLCFIFFLAAPGFTKWVFITPIALLGAAFTFLPVNGVSFDKWLLMFIRTITSPSKRVWRKEPKEISFLAPAFAHYFNRPTMGLVTPSRPSLETLLSQIKVGRTLNKLDALEQTRLNLIDFGQEKPFSVIRADQAEPKAPLPLATKASENAGPAGSEQTVPTTDEKLSEVEKIQQSFSGLAGPTKEGP